MSTATTRSSMPQVAALGAIGAGAAVAVALGVFASTHDPALASVPRWGFPDVISMKVWLGLVVGVLALVQLLSALWMYGRFGATAPGWVGTAHRASGALAVLVSLPVAYACLVGLGFYTGDVRVILHSTGGCLFYGAFVAKVIGLHTRGPGWLVPVAGGTLFTILVVVVLTSAAWYLSSRGLPSSGY